MIFYYIIFSYLVIYSLREKVNTFNAINPHHIIVLLAMVFFIGFRYEVGVDWDGYNAIYNQVGKSKFLEILSFDYSIIYYLLNWIGNNLNIEIWFVNFICSLLFILGIYFIAKISAYPFLTILVSFPYSILVFSMNLVFCIFTNFIS